MRLSLLNSGSVLPQKRLSLSLYLGRNRGPTCLPNGLRDPDPTGRTQEKPVTIGRSPVCPHSNQVFLGWGDSGTQDPSQMWPCLPRLVVPGAALGMVSCPLSHLQHVPLQREGSWFGLALPLFASSSPKSVSSCLSRGSLRAAQSVPWGSAMSSHWSVKAEE